MFAPVYIVFLLVILKLLVGEESLPAVPELPPVRTDCAPVDAAVSPRAVCWHYPTRTPLEKTLAYAPANHPAVDALMRDVLARVEVSSPHPRSSAPVILRGFDDAAQLLAFYRAEPHELYAGVLFPRLLDANADGDGDGDDSGSFPDSASRTGSLRVDEPFSVLVNGSYVPPPRATSAGAGDACRPLFRPDDTVYDAGARGGRLPTFCGSMTFLSAGVTHVQSAVASALGARALGASSTGDGSYSYAVDLSFAQAPLGAYERSFGSLTMRLFASVYLTLSLASLLGASANQTSEDRRTRRRAVAESAGLLPSAYWAGTAALLVGSFAFSATCLVTVTVCLGLFGFDSFAALTLLAVAFSTSLASLGFLVAAAARSSRDVGVAVGALQLLAPALFVPLTYFGGSGAALTAASLLSPVAFAASMDVAVQAEAGRDPLTLANFASRNVGRDVASGGAGGTHPLTAAGAFGMMVFDAALYAALAWYAETARAWRDPWFFARRRFWRGSPIFGNAFGDSDAARHVAVEMGDPTRGGRYEVLDENALANDAEDDEEDEEDEDRDDDRDGDEAAATSAATSAATAPRSRLVRGIRRRRARLVTSIKLEDVRAEDDAAEDDVCDDDVHVGSPPRGFLSSTLGLVRSSRRRRRRRDGGSRRRAVVDGVTVSAHDGQVLALLGHAGSGASETLEVMSGRRPRSAGAMEFRGAPVAARWSPVELGASVGLCPSRDALEGLLTPREHLAFAARLHRQTTSSASASAMNGYHAFASAEDRDATEGLLREAGLGEGHAPNAPVEGLDPGARRALQVAMAFVGAALPVREDDGRDGDGDGDGDGSGDSASRGCVVLLDDPTGDRADPATRRATWAMIRAPRAAPTTVVIVTRSVAEATAVADRVAVISHGRVKCCGGLTFLRKLYGLGYRLHVALAPEPEPTDADADAKVAPLARDRSLELLDAVRRRVPEAELARDPSSRDSAFFVDRDASASGSGSGSGPGSGSASQSVVVSLADHAGRIGALLADLESDADRLGVRDVALEATSLEEAFARLGQESRRERETVPDFAGDADLDDDLDVGLLRADERDVVAGLAVDATNHPASASSFAFDRPHGDRPFGFGFDASDRRNAFAFFKSRLRARARRPGSSASLYLTPALVALALCAAQVASSTRSSAVSESFLARATWQPPDASSSRGVGAACAGSARADCGAAEFGSAGVGEVVPVTFAVAADASESVAEDARAIMRASFDGADPSSAERADGDAPADYAGTAPLPGPGGLHVRFGDANLRARRVAASVIYDPLTDVHVLPRVVSEFHTAFARAAAAAAAGGSGNASHPGSGGGSTSGAASASVDLSATLVNLPQETPLGAAWSYLAAIAVPIAMCAFPAAAVASAVAERVSSTRLTLALAGLSSRSYWAATFAADATCGAIGACAAAIAGSIVGVAPWDPAAAPAMLASLLASIPSSFALAYVASFRHDDAAHASSQMHFFLVFFAFLLLAIVASMEDDSAAKRKWHFAASAIVPSYAALGNAHVVAWRALSDDNGARAPVPGDYFRGDRGELVAIGAFGAMCGAVAWGLALVAAEAATRRRLRAGSRAGAALAAAATDAEPSPFVAAERERVERFARRASNGASRNAERPRDGPRDDAPSFAFAACGVSAPRPPDIGDDRDLFRDAREGYAANVWFGVEPGEIVCVVGSRDSGKEALARCAAGMDPFAGDALFADGAASARKGGVAALASAGVGACLRDDAFVDETATPLEHLELIAAFRGARNPARVAREIAAAAGLFDRDGDPTGVDGDDVGGDVPNVLAETPLRALDASARRRTSLAAATVGDPAVLILDAPTRAVDSSARRRVWRRLADHARRGGAVLASTDAVDEAEAIASRVVAMADGRVVDLGTPRQLKARHGAAYTLKVQLRGDGRDGTDASSNPASRDDAEATHALVASAAPPAAGATAAWDGARECRYELAAMRLPELARLCATLDAATGRVVEGYTLSQPTLAQTFLHLAAGRDAARGRETDPASGTYAPGGGFPTGGRRNGGV